MKHKNNKNNNIFTKVKNNSQNSSSKFSNTPLPNREKIFIKTKRSNTTYEKKSSYTPKLKGLWLYGLHPVKSALLNNKRKIYEIRVTEETYNELSKSQLKEASIDIKVFEKKDITLMAPEGAIHQGIMALVEPLAGIGIETIIDTLDDKSATVVILDQITDPHNVGAILRSSAIFGAAAVIVTDNNAPQETGILAKSASGALEKIPYIQVINLKRCVLTLKEAGFWCVGFDGDSNEDLNTYSPAPRTAIIMGAEGSGMRRLTKESCDTILSIDTPKSDEILDSLNVSNATAIALFVITSKFKK